MGCMATKTAADYSVQAHTALIEKLGMTTKQARAIATAFHRIDVNHDGQLALGELFDALELVLRSHFNERLFRVFDTNCNEMIDFREFLIATWNYCPFSRSQLEEFAFALYDLDDSGKLNTQELTTLVAEVYGIPDDLAKKKVLAAIVKEANVLAKPDGLMTLTAFRVFVLRHPGLLQPAYALQQRLQRAVCGEKFWHKATKFKFKGAKADARMSPSRYRKTVGGLIGADFDSHATMLKRRERLRDDGLDGFMETVAEGGAASDDDDGAAGESKQAPRRSSNTGLKGMLRRVNGNKIRRKRRSSGYGVAVADPEELPGSLKLTSPSSTSRRRRSSASSHEFDSDKRLKDSARKEGQRRSRTSSNASTGSNASKGKQRRSTGKPPTSPLTEPDVLSNGAVVLPKRKPSRRSRRSSREGRPSVTVESVGSDDEVPTAPRRPSLGKERNLARRSSEMAKKRAARVKGQNALGDEETKTPTLGDEVTLADGTKMTFDLDMQTGKMRWRSVDANFSAASKREQEYQTDQELAKYFSPGFRSKGGGLKARSQSMDHAAINAQHTRSTLRARASMGSLYEATSPTAPAPRPVAHGPGAGTTVIGNRTDVRITSYASTPGLFAGMVGKTGVDTRDGYARRRKGGAAYYS